MDWNENSANGDGGCASLIHPTALSTLQAYLWGAAVILRGLVDAGDYKQFIFPLVFYKRLSDVWDEDYAAALATYDGDVEPARAEADERFVIPEGAHWSNVRQLPKDIGRALQTAMRAIEAANPGRFDGIFGDAYEYLIGRFADDGGHTAQEFYTNRTVVHLMTQMLAPRAGERIYDPTCGTGGMLIAALAEVKRRGGEHRTLGLFGHERNHMTASIARMNLVLHGVEDFHIARGDTLDTPHFTQQDRLATFDVVLANPPYSIKRWNRDAWQSDVWGRNTLGTPPQRQGRVLFIDAVNEIARERAYSFLKPEHQQRIADAYHRFADQPGFCHVAEQDSIAANGHSLSIPLYVKRHEHNAEAGNSEDRRTLREVWDDWEDEGRVFWRQMDALVDTLDGLTADQPDSNAKSHSSMRRARCPTTET